jgi:hypothetical protein
MTKRWLLLTTIASLAVLGATARANAEAFKNPSQCVPGTRVADSSGVTGTVIGVTEQTMCQVKLDKTGKPYPYLFWMLHPAGGSAETNDKLIVGRYACYVGRNYTFMDVYITGANTYSTKAGAGTFSVLASRKIVFASGPLKKDFGKLMAGPNIDLNTDGSSFYGTTCSYQKH